MGKRNQKSNVILAVLLALLGTLSLSVLESSALDNPHNVNKGISCASCHASSLVTSTWFTDQENGVCGSCHGSVATTAMTHKQAGVVRAQCTDCHDPHSQPQNRTFKTESYRATGTVVSLTSTTLVVSGVTLPDNFFVDHVLLPDVRYQALSYRIVANTANTITISNSGGDGINLTYCKPGATFGIVWGRLVRSNVNGYAVRFFQETGANSFADGTNAGICQVCHTSTTYFTPGNTDTAAHSGASQVGKNCTGCHQHDDSSGGFVAPAPCQDCHGNPPVDAASLLIKDKNKNSITSDSAGAGAHSKHVSAYNFACATCHSGGMVSDAAQANNNITIGFSFNTTSLGGTYYAKTRTTFPVEAKAPTTLYTSASGTLGCAVYCHDPSNAGVKSAAWTTVVAANPECDTCHGGNKSATNAIGVGRITSGKHDAHINNTDTNLATFACGRCHAATVWTSNDRVITDASKHVNNVKDVVYDSLNSGATSNACNNTYCHSDGKGNPINYTLSAAWYTGAAIGCAGCHGTTNGTGAPDYVSGGGGVASANSHTYHVTVSADCGICHTNTTTLGTSITGTRHLDKSIDVTISANYDSDTNQFNNYNGSLGNKTCSNVTCHGPVSPQWGANTANNTCTKCHGKPTSTGYSLKDAAPGAGGTGIDLSGNSANTTAKVGAHRAHLETMHGWSTAVACSICHTVPGGWNSLGHLYNGTNDTTKGTAEVIFSGVSHSNWTSVAGTPTYSSGNCSNTYCHDSRRFKNGWGSASNPTPAWNDASYLSANACGQCHGYPPESAGGTKHTTDSNCKTCHGNVNSTNDGFINASQHINGYLEAVTGCTGCHGNWPLWNTIGQGGLATPATGATSPINVGAHDKHLNPLTGRGMSCEACHAGYTGAAMPSVKIDMGFQISTMTYPGFWGTLNSGSFAGYVPLTNGNTWNASAAGTTITTVNSYANANTCAVYCHGSTLTGGSITQARWTSGPSQTACGTCHGGTGYTSAAATPPTTGAHNKHANTSTYGIACNICHNSTPQDMSHVNGNVAWSFSTDPRVTSATYNGQASGATNALAPSASYGACANTYCHTNGQWSTHAAFNWTTTPTTCTSCHGGPTSGTLSAAHAAHVNDTGNKVGFSIACNVCHSATAASITTVNSYVYHVDRNVNVRFNNTLNLDSDTPTFKGSSAASGVAGGSWKTVGSAAGACNNVYCHSSGNVNGGTVPTTFSNISWNTTIGCGGCHGNSATLRAHPVYASGLAGSQTANSHVKHVESSSLTCDLCHNTTVNTAWTTFSAATAVVASGAHLNRTDDISFAPNGGKWGSYNAGAKTCQSTYCHGSGVSPAWGTTTNCTSCHDATNSGSMSLAHGKHYNSATAPTVLAGGTDAHTTTAYAYACLQCHPTDQHAKGSWNSMADATVIGGAKISWYTVGSSNTNDGKNYKYSVNGTCATICHSKDGVTAGNAIFAPTWSSAASNGCGACHNKQGDASPTWSAAHGKHINTYNANTNFTCSTCHNGTAASNSALQATAQARTQHPNGNRDLAMNSGFVGGAWVTVTGAQGSQTCANTYCHSNGTSTTGSHAAMAWNTTVTCTSCHGGPTSGTLSAAHAVHVNDTGNKVGFSVACNECHGATASSITTINSSGGYAVHVDKNVNIRFDNGTRNKDTDGPTFNAGSAASGVAGGATKAVGAASGACNNVYCHSSGNVNGQTAPTTFSNISWNTTIGCGGCHGNSATLRAHPVYASGLAGSATANSHVKHVESSSLTCDLCHNTTVNTAWTTFSATTAVVASGAHLNRTDDISFAPNGGKWGSYNAGAKTCQSTYCHGSGVSPAWGTTTNCTSCHDATNSGSMSLAHGKHYNSATAPTVLAGGTDAHTTTAYAYACLQCHPTDQHAKGSWNSMADATVIGGAKISWYTVGSSNTTDGQSYKYSVNGTCATICHSKDGVTAGNSIFAPTWSSAASNGCGACHNKQGDASPTWSAAHSRHINTYNANTNFTCSTCHNGTAASNSALQATAQARTQHPNGNRDLSMNAFVGGAWVTITGAQGSQTCANIYCHSNGTSTTGNNAPMVWTTVITNCTSCHGGPATWTTSGATAATGAHFRHVKDNGYSCNACHSATASSMTTIGNYPHHVDQNVDISISSSYSTIGATYNGQPVAWNTIYMKPVGGTKGSCATNFCHGGTSSNWNSVNLSTATCVKCHGVAGATVAQFNADKRMAAPGWTTGASVGRNTSNTSGTLTNGVSNDSKVGAHNKHLNAYSVWGTIGYTNDIACTNCHTLWTTVGEVGHMNGATSFNWSSFARNSGTDWTAATGVITPSYSNGTCATVYCHGGGFPAANRGNGISLGWTSNAYLTSARWTTVGCNQCHLSPPAVKHDGATPHDNVALGTCNSCHGHEGWGTNHINGKLEASGGGCNGCHWYDTTDAGAWTTVKSASGGLWNSTNAWGAHVKHINHLKTRYSIANLNAASDQWGTVGGANSGNFAKVCGFCHSKDKAADHGPDSGSATRNIWSATSERANHQFGPSLPSWNTLAAQRSCSNVDCHYKPKLGW